MTAFISRQIVAYSTSSSVTKVAALPLKELATTSLVQLPSFHLAESASSFEPIAPDSTTLLGFGAIVVLCAAAGWVWANQVVPVSRTNLALSKKKGQVRDYLNDLREADSNSTALISNSTDTTDITDPAVEDRAFERWLFTDWLEKPQSKGGRQKEPALPILKDAKWNSGDNPVLAATGLIMLGVLLTAVTERIATTSF